MPQYEIINYYTNLKKSLEEIALGQVIAPIEIIHHDVLSGVEYRDKFSLSECNIRLAFEGGGIINVSDIGKVLDKPTIVLYVEESNKNTGRGRTQGDLLVEFQIVCDASKYKRVKLDAYSQLIQVICDPNENGGFWVKRGLLPRYTLIGEIRDGSIFGEDFTNRLLLRSVIVNFSVIGELHVARCG